MGEMKVAIASQGWSHPGTSMYTHSTDVMAAAKTAGVDVVPMPLKSYRGARVGGLLRPLLQRTFNSYPRVNGEIVHHIDQDTLRGVDVVTIHDLGVFHGVSLNNEFADRFFRSAIRTATKRAKRVILTTESSKEDLARLIGGNYGVDKHDIYPKLRVVPVPHKDVTNERLPQKYDAIWIGRNAPNKRVLDYLALASRFPDRKFALRCSRSPGRPALDETLERGLKMLPNMERITGNPTDDDLDRLYRSTKVYVATSSYEGWHRPPTEHYLRGGQIVVPEIAPYTEIYAPGYPFWFEPDRHGSIDHAFQEAIDAPCRGPDATTKELVSFRNVGKKLRAVYEEAARS